MTTVPTDPSLSTALGTGWGLEEPRASYAGLEEGEISFCSVVVSDGDARGDRETLKRSFRAHRPAEGLQAESLFGISVGPALADDFSHCAVLAQG